MNDNLNSATNNGEELSEEDIDNFLQNEEESSLPIDDKHIPKLGMKFKSHTEARGFFNFYAYLAGFSVVIAHHYKTTSKKRQGEITKYTYKCNLQGKNEPANKKKSNEQVTEQQRETVVLVKTNCKCTMVAKEVGQFWQISRLDLNHNHALCPRREAKFLRSHKDMTEEEKRLIRTLKECNIPTRSMIVILSFLRGGLAALPYTKKDVSNVGTAINSETRNNDMKQVLNYLKKKEQDDPGMYYKFKLDEENKVTSMFWTDGRSTQLYEEYGDCISFDTTYRTNRYNMPFAPFVGVTGHGSTCLFGCAFLGDETAETFKWVFETFITAMGGKHPKTIITDQDNAMRSAIAQVFQNTKHRNCLFHIKKNCREKIGSMFSAKANRNLYEEYDDILNNCLTEEEFEVLWPQMIEKFSLQNIKYLQLMWKNRAQFVPVYFKYDFCPFIQSTALSEGTNSRFKRGVGPQHSVMSFMKEYENINDTIFDTEYSKDFQSRTKMPKTLWFNYLIEEQASELYNLDIFRKFQNELKDTLRLQVSVIQQGKVYEVFVSPNSIQQEYRQRKHIVIIDLPNENFGCICGKFSKDGMLCSHILKVMLELNVRKIPEKYIIDRWRKKEKKEKVKGSIHTDATDNSVLMFNVLSRKGADIASKASKRKRTYQFMMEELEKLEMNVQLMIEQEAETHLSQDESNTVQNDTVQHAEEEIIEEVEIEDPDLANTKGRKPKRYRRIVEKMIETSKRKSKDEQHTTETSKCSKIKNPHITINCRNNKFFFAGTSEITNTGNKQEEMKTSKTTKRSNKQINYNTYTKMKLYIMKT